MFDDRLTEQQNPLSQTIDRLSSLEIVGLINREDQGVAAAVGQVDDAVARAVDLAAGAFRTGGRLIYVGAGTSGRLGVLDAAEMPPTYGTPPEMVQGVIAGGFQALVRAQEGAEDDPHAGALAMEHKEVCERDFVLGIATSGTTPFVHGALRRAREQGARTGFLLCTPPPKALLDSYDVVIAPLVGAEVITGSTRMKAGTATKMVLNSITTAAMVRCGKVDGNLMVDLQVTCQKLQDRGERILMAKLEIGREDARTLLDRAGDTSRQRWSCTGCNSGRATRVRLWPGRAAWLLKHESPRSSTEPRERFRRAACSGAGASRRRPSRVHEARPLPPADPGGTPGRLPARQELAVLPLPLPYTTIRHPPV